MEGFGEPSICGRASKTPNRETDYVMLSELLPSDRLVGFILHNTNFWV